MARKIGYNDLLSGTVGCVRNCLANIRTQFIHDFAIAPTENVAAVPLSLHVKVRDSDVHGIVVCSSDRNKGGSVNVAPCQSANMTTKNKYSGYGCIGNELVYNLESLATSKERKELIRFCVWDS